jgi:UDP-N-acetylmuramoyl-tripeptide--D-alanyl-D-alanine ligase
MLTFDLFYETSGVCTDTRRISKDCLFVCLKGENFNGNTFSEQALSFGAKYVIVDEAKYATNNRIFLVDDSLLFLQQLANYHRRKFQIPIIGITGSNGKTSTKELIREVLSRKYNVLATEGNLNNHIGVPLTLLKINSKHELAIIEMGANKLKDIEELCKISEPSHGIITNVGKAHLEGFLSFEGVLKTKTELYQSISNINGTIFYNLDDSVLMEKLPKNTPLFSYSANGKSDVIGELVELNPFVKMKWKTSDFNSDVIQTKMIGSYNFYNFLAAIAIGLFFEVDENEISKAISDYETNEQSVSNY